MIVVDASVVLEALLHRASTAAVSERLLAAREVLHAPHLLDVEVAHVIRRYAAIGDIAPERGQAALAVLADLPLRRYGHDFLLPRVWELRNNFTAYDAVYVALAEALDVPLLLAISALRAPHGPTSRSRLCKAGRSSSRTPG